MGRRLDSPVPSFARYGPTCRSSQRSTFEPSSTPAAPTPSSPRNTLRPTGVPSMRSGYGRATRLDQHPENATGRSGAEGQDLGEAGLDGLGEVGRVGDRERVGVDPDAAGAAVREQRDVRGGTREWTERVEALELGARHVPRE